MGDETKPLSSGDRWRPSAAALNRLQEAADDLAGLQQSGGALAQPQLRREMGVCVLVKNEGAEHETWPIWSPVGVVAPPGDIFGQEIKFFNRPYFRGCRLDDYSFDQTINRILGITQEPIPYGKTGRVCIQGLTPCLVWDIEKDQHNAQEYPSRDYVQAEKNGARWMMRYAPCGDGKILDYLQTTSHKWYQDGTYNDQMLHLIDLRTPPDQGIRFANVGTTIPAYSIIPGGQYWLSAIPPVTQDQGDWAMVPTSMVDWYVTPGWDVTGQVVPCRRVTPGQIYCLRMYDLDSMQREVVYGVASGKLWPGLSGFMPIAQHFLKRGSERYAAPPYFGWFRYTGEPSMVRAKWVTNTVYLLNGNNVYDGVNHGGVTHPLCTARVEQVGSGYYLGWNLKKADSANLTFYGTGVHDAATQAVYLRPAPYFADDMCGTIKMWTVGVPIPPGWIEYTAMRGKYPLGNGGTYSPPTATAGSSQLTIPHTNVIFIQRSDA